MPDATAATDEATGRAIELLLKLNRAVQRATVYPDGHPSVATAIALLHRSLSSLIEQGGALRIGVTGEGFVVADRPIENGGELLAWLARRLHDQRVGLITFTPGVAEPDLTAFVGWVARKGVSPEPPELRQIDVTMVDYGRARFDEQRRDDTREEADPLRVWRSLLDGLTAGWYQGDLGTLPEEPEACAAELSAEVERNEGVGAASFLAGIVGAGSRLPRMGEPARQTVRARLATFVAGLSPELRRQLLHVDPSASARKLDFLADMAEALPDTTLMEVISDLDKQGERISDSFLGLLNRLVGLSVREPSLRELTETKLVSIGLPRGLTLMDPVHVRAMLEQALRHSRDADFTPSDHETTIERLSSGVATTAHPWSRYRERTSAETVSARVADIVLRLLVAAPDHPDAAAYVRRLTTEAPRALAAGRFDQLYETASSLRDLLVLRRYVPSEVPQLVQEHLAFLRQPDTIGTLLSALENAEWPAPASVVGLARLASPEAAVLALERIAALPAGDARGQLADFVSRLKPDTLGEVVTRARVAAGPALDGLFVLLARPETPGRVDCALTFIGNRDPAVRLRALALLIEADQRPGQRERYLLRALSDAAAAVRDFAIEATRHAGDARAVSALRDFLLSRTPGEADASARQRALAVLGAMGTAEARAALAELLRARHLSLWPRDVRVCLAAAALLAATDDEALRAAARAWRRSPSGWMAWLLGRASGEQEEAA